MEYTIPKGDALRADIIRTLVNTKRATEKDAIKLCNDEGCYRALAESRRYYYYLRALGKVDRFTPFPFQRGGGNSGMFATDESLLYWLSVQTWQAFVTQQDFDRELKRRGTSNARTSAAWQPRRALLKRYAAIVEQPRQLAHAASV
jgi:hypothetical protein